MVFALNYRRPSHVSGSGASISGQEKQLSINESVNSDNSGLSGTSTGIPGPLSFDRIIAGGTCPPCTTRDFMNYLKYIELDAENLQFYLWFKSYVERWVKLSESEKALSPEWTEAQAEAELNGNNGMRKRNKFDPMVTSILQGTDFDDKLPTAHTVEKRDPFRDGTRTPSTEEEKREFTSSEYTSSFGDSRTFNSNSTHVTKADSAFDEAGLQWKPFTAQPFRQEVSRIIAIYIAVDSPRQLNLSDRERTAVLHALQNTTHPSAFRAAVTSAEWSLRRQAHPNFIRWTICNGNRPRVIFARGLGIVSIFGGILACLLITLSNVGRAWRVLPIIILLIGISTMIAAWKGMCVVLHGMHHRHLRPWELFADGEDANGIETRDMSKDSLASSHSNSYEDEPWVARYQKRNVVRKVFDREVWIQEPALRQIQDTIFIQSLLGALVCSCIIVGIFCAVPHGGFY